MWRIGIMSKIYVTKSALGDLMFYSGTDAGVIEFNDFLGGRLEERAMGDMVEYGLEEGQTLLDEWDGE